MILSLIQILVFAILMLFGSCLLDPPCVFVIIITIWVPANNIVLNVSHGLKMSAVWLVFGPLNDDRVDVVWVWILNLFEWRSDLHLFRTRICTALSSHNRMCIVK